MLIVAGRVLAAVLKAAGNGWMDKDTAITKAAFGKMLAWLAWVHKGTIVTSFAMGPMPTSLLLSFLP